MYYILFEKKYGTKNQFNIHLVHSEQAQLRFANDRHTSTISSVVKTASISSKNEKVLSNLNKSLNMEDGLEILYFLCFHEFGLPPLELQALMKKCEELL